MLKLEDIINTVTKEGAIFSLSFDEFKKIEGYHFLHKNKESFKLTYTENNHTNILLSCVIDTMDNEDDFSNKILNQMEKYLNNCFIQNFLERQYVNNLDNLKMGENNIAQLFLIEKSLISNCENSKLYLLKINDYYIVGSYSKQALENTTLYKDSTCKIARITKEEYDNGFDRFPCDEKCELLWKKSINSWNCTSIDYDLNKYTLRDIYTLKKVVDTSFDLCRDTFKEFEKAFIVAALDTLKRA